jgi:hypothetical protein
VTGASRVLLTESSSLTAREHLSVLGPAGVTIEAMSSDLLALCRWSRWLHRMHPCPEPSADPLGYLRAMAAVLAAGDFDAVLPTHEQAWLLAVGRDRLPAGTPLALASPESFARVQGKTDFAGLLDELGVPQPAWRLVPGSAVAGLPDRAAQERVLDGFEYPYYLKAAYGTAGRTVRHVTDDARRSQALAELDVDGRDLIAQQPAPGEYGQVQALCRHGQVIAVHTSVLAGQGLGGSAAARRGIDHPQARAAVSAVAAALSWHGGLTVDYFHTDGVPQFIECNPRTVEPGNAAACGVDLPGLSIDLARDVPPPAQQVRSRREVSTHSTMALLLGASERPSPRRSVFTGLGQALTGRGSFAGPEVLTPLRRDPLSAVPLLVVGTQLLLSPAAGRRTAAAAVRNYAITPDTIDRLLMLPRTAD